MNTSTTVFNPVSETDLQSFLLNFAVNSDFSLALWRLPNNSARHMILAQQNDLVSKNSPLEDMPTGFIFSPFDRTQDSIFLKAQYSFSFDDGLLKNPETQLEISSSTWLNGLDRNTLTKKKRVAKSTLSFTETSRSAFLNLVTKAIELIETGAVEKIVPSRLKKISLPEHFDVTALFQKLCKNYPNALVSIVYTPEYGVWVGVTPETLVSIEDKTIFKTVALAGTKPYDESISLKNVAWTQKEIEEQALVERYIISCFKKIRLREYDEHGPKTSVAGNLMHLRSDFTVDMKATNFPQLGSVMLNLLHPTSAVCGMPLDNALEFLKSNEGYDREFYAGYLGPVNFHRDTHVFVNLRCMQVLEDSAILYAGAGVTLDSVPEHEWNETEMKFNTLLSVIQS
jgi:isochorismate synthase